MTPESAAVAVTDGGLVYGTSGNTFKYPPQGFVLDLASGETTVIGLPDGAYGLSVISGNDRREALVLDDRGVLFLWNDGTYRRVADLVEFGWEIFWPATKLNARGQILVSRYSGNSRAVLLSPQ